jgi:trypsin
LVNPTTLITAAHCSTGFKRKTLTVNFHRHDLRKSTEEENGITVKVKEIIPHPNYERSIVKNDVAIWKLTRSPFLVSRPAEYKVVLANNTLSREDTYLTIAGWGSNGSTEAHAEILNEAEVPVSSRNLCKSWYPWAIYSSFCAGYLGGGTDTCQGDSGGPIFTTDNRGQTTLVGITSFGYGCAMPLVPGVYTSVASRNIRRFIERYLGDKY